MIETAGEPLKVQERSSSQGPLRAGRGNARGPRRALRHPGRARPAGAAAGEAAAGPAGRPGRGRDRPGQGRFPGLGPAHRRPAAAARPHRTRAARRRAGGHRHRVRRRGPRRSRAAHRPRNRRRDRRPFRPDLDRGLRRLRARIRVHGGGEPAAGSAPPQLAAHRSPRRFRGAGRQLFGRVPAPFPGRLAADRAHQRQDVGPGPGAARPGRPRPPGAVPSGPGCSHARRRASRGVAAIAEQPRSLRPTRHRAGTGCRQDVTPRTPDRFAGPSEPDPGPRPAWPLRPGRLRRRRAGPGLAAPGQPPRRQRPRRGRHRDRRRRAQGPGRRGPGPRRHRGAVGH